MRGARLRRAWRFEQRAAVARGRVELAPAVGELGLGTAQRLVEEQVQRRRGQDHRVPADERTAVGCIRAYALMAHPLLGLGEHCRESVRLGLGGGGLGSLRSRRGAGTHAGGQRAPRTHAWRMWLSCSKLDHTGQASTSICRHATGGGLPPQPRSSPEPARRQNFDAWSHASRLWWGADHQLSSCPFCWPPPLLRWLQSSRWRYRAYR